MSRIGKKPVVLPSGVTATFAEGTVQVKGPKGSLSLTIHPQVTLKVNPDSVIVEVAKPTDKKQRALWGLHRALIQNIVDGVVTGYSKELDIVGVGFKAEVQARKVILHLGFSHPITFELPEGIEVKAEKNPTRVGIQQYQTSLTISGIDRQKVGQVAAEIRDLKKPEPYKGKGIKYSDEVIIRKAGKTVKAVGK